MSVPCRLCGDQTDMEGTKLCDRCWELETRIRRDPNLARKIVDRVELESADAFAAAEEATWD